MKRIFLIVFSLAIFLSAVESVNACWCRKDREDTNTQENFRKYIQRQVDYSDVVFVGKFVENNDSQMLFEIGKSWKGKLSGKVFFAQNFGTGNKTDERFFDSCTYYFEPGKSYLVFGSMDMTGFSAGKCGQTDFLENAERTVNELDKQTESTSN